MSIFIHVHGWEFRKRRGGVVETRCVKKGLPWALRGYAETGRGNGDYYNIVHMLERLITEYPTAPTPPPTVQVETGVKPVADLSEVM